MKLRTALLGATASLTLASMAWADAHEGERGRDGQLSIIYWQAPSTMNPYRSGGHEGKMRRRPSSWCWKAWRGFGQIPARMVPRGLGTKGIPTVEKKRRRVRRPDVVSTWNP